MCFIHRVPSGRCPEPEGNSSGARRSTSGDTAALAYPQGASGSPYGALRHSLRSYLFLACLRHATAPLAHWGDTRGAAGENGRTSPALSEIRVTWRVGRGDVYHGPRTTDG